MIGFVYLGITAICSFIENIKEAHHDIHAVVDPRTNTFIDYHGVERDKKTLAVRIWTRDIDGNEVLIDKKHNVVRNLTLEDREKKSEEVLSKKTGQKAFDTSKSKGIYPAHGLPSTARVYADTNTLEEYAVVYITVPYDSGKDEKEFYVKFNDPEKLLCISDKQREYEMQRKKYAKYNWIDYPDDEQKFIRQYNNLPIEYGSKRCPILRFK